MAAQTIIQMRESRTEIRELINKFPVKKYIKQEFGAESEYSAQGVLSGLEGLLTDISTLTGASNKFIKASTYAERYQINGILSRLSSNLQNENLAQVAAEIDTLKPIIRNYGTRYTEERYVAFMDNIDEIQKKSSISSRNLEEAIKLHESSEEIFGVVV